MGLQCRLGDQDAEAGDAAGPVRQEAEGCRALTALGEK